MSNPLKRDLWYFHMKAEEIEEKVWTFCQLTDQLEEIKVDFIKRGTNTSTVDKWLHIAGEQMIKFIKGIDDCSAALYDHYGVSQQFALDCTFSTDSINLIDRANVESIANRIADINLNESIEESYVELVEDESPVVGENPENTVRTINEESFEFSYVRQPNIRMVDLGEVQLCITHVVSPDELYTLFPLTDNAERRFSHLYAKMSSYYRSGTVSPIDRSVLYKLPPCAIKWGDENWQRGRVRKVEENNTDILDVQVFLEDKGKLITCRSDQIFPLKPEFANEVPRQVIICKLWGIKPVGGSHWSEAATEELEQISHGTPIMTGLMVNESEPLEVILSITDGTTAETVNDLLIRMGLAMEK